MNREIASSGPLSSAPAVRSAPASGAVRLAAVVGFAALTAVAARFAVPIPGTVVPLTLQVTVVLLAGFLLGPRLGAASQALYVGAGVIGLPVFAAGGGAFYLLGPTGGYLVAFPLAAAAVGWLARRDAGFIRLLLAGAAGLGIIYAGGAAWLSTTVGLAEAVRSGVLPFLLGGILKLGLAVLVAARLAGPARRTFTRG